MAGILAPVAFLSLLLLASPAIAAEQGVPGAGSKGEIAIAVTVASRVTMADVKAGATGVPAGAQLACLWLDTATRGYAVTALGAPVAWHASATSRASATVVPGTTLANLSAPAGRPDCGRDPSLLVGYDAVGGAGSRPATLLIAPE